jgi:rhodanese-related sulfurtransferase
MNWNMVLVVLAVVAALLLLKRAGQVSPAAARQFLKQGALVIDVRSAAEFQSGHLPRAVNLPLDELRAGIAQHAPDKGQVLLLHCLSGTRSAMARQRLKRMGYTQVFNLGSYSRARKICEEQ